MKLNVTFGTDPETGKERAVVTDDRGHRMPGIRGVDVRYRFDAPSEVVLTLVVDRKKVTLGTPMSGEGRNAGPRQGRWVPMQDLTKGERAVFEAITQLFPAGDDLLKHSDRDQRIQDHLRQLGASKYSAKTIARCLKKIEFSPEAR